MKRILLSTALIAALAGCAGTTGQGPQDDYSRLVAQTENEIKLAAKTGFLWRDTEELLKQSEDAKAAGDMNKAMKLAKEALRQAQLAQEQARENANPEADYSYTK